MDYKLQFELDMENATDTSIYEEVFNEDLVVVANEERCATDVTNGECVTGVINEECAYTVNEELVNVTNDTAECKESEKSETNVTKRGRKPRKKRNGIDNANVKLEKSRQSAKQCRARKKLRYQNLDEEIRIRELEVLELRREMEQLCDWMQQLKNGEEPSPSLIQFKKDNQALIDKRADEILSGMNGVHT